MTRVARVLGNKNMQKQECHRHKSPSAKKKQLPITVSQFISKGVWENGTLAWLVHQYFKRRVEKWYCETKTDQKKLRLAQKIPPAFAVSDGITSGVALANQRVIAFFDSQLQPKTKSPEHKCSHFEMYLGINNVIFKGNIRPPRKDVIPHHWVMCSKHVLKSTFQASACSAAILRKQNTQWTWKAADVVLPKEPLSTK